jgi:hypothetical protein
MSIVALKRKTETKYNNMSVGSKTGFSLNGTHRNQGFVGQSVISRSLPKTLMKGNTVRGHGSCCGVYRQLGIVQSAVNSTNDATVVKKSVVGTNGMLNTKYRWIRRPAPYISVKPDSNMSLNTQSQYVENLAKNTLKIEKDCEEDITIDTSKKPNYNVYYKKEFCDYTKPESEYLPVTSGEHIRSLNKKCQLLDVFTYPKTTSGTPFAGSV